MSHLSKRIVAACAAAGLAGLTGLASAQGYVGIGVGQSRIKLDCSGTDTCDKTDTAFRLFGGYQFSPNLALEAAYYDQGKAHLTASDFELGSVGAEFKGHGVGLWGMLTLPLEAVTVFAKVGMVSSSLKLDASSSTFGRASGSERHTRAAWGLGASYGFASQWVARLDYERLRLRFMDEGVSVDLVTLGAHYRF